MSKTGLRGIVAGLFRGRGEDGGTSETRESLERATGETPTQGEPMDSDARRTPTGRDQR